MRALAVDRLPIPNLAAPAAVSAIAAGVVYCQAHGALSGDHAPLGVSLWWSASGLLPALAVLGLAARHAGPLRRAPIAAVPFLLAAFATAVALGEILYGGDLADAAAWSSALFRALPVAAGLALVTFAGVGALRPAAEAREPAPPPALPSEVALIRSAGNYLSVETGGREALIRLPLHEAARRLAARGFVQAHRTALVNTARVAELRHEGGRLVLRLDDGRTVAVGRAYARRVRSSLAARRSSQDR